MSQEEKAAMARIDEVAVPLTAATDIAVVGAKAAALSRAAGDGHRVPDGVVITVDAARTLTSATTTNS